MEAGLRQIDIAEQMNRSVSTIKKWESENGPSPGTLEDLSRLCQIIGISIDYYVNGRAHRSRFTKDDLRLIELAGAMTDDTRHHFESIGEMLLQIQNRDESRNEE